MFLRIGVVGVLFWGKVGWTRGGWDCSDVRQMMRWINLCCRGLFMQKKRKRKVMGLAACGWVGKGGFYIREHFMD